MVEAAGIEPASGNVQHQGYYMLSQSIKDSQHPMPFGRLQDAAILLYLARLRQEAKAGQPAFITPCPATQTIPGRAPLP